MNLHRLATALLLLRSAVGEQRGQAMVLLSLTMTAMCGMAALAVDGGMLLQERRAIQNATDAAVLAAAAHLPHDEAGAVDAAVEYSALNGYTLSPSDVSVSSTNSANDTVEVTNEVTASLFFARVLGFTEATPGATASAQIGAVGGATGAMPFGIEPQAFQPGQSYCLKLGTGSCGQPQQGNFHALDIDDLGNSSANIYRDKIRDGSSKTIRIGDIKDVNTGNMAGATRQGVGCQGNNGRLTGNTQDFDDVVEVVDGIYSVIDWNSPRLVVVPIVDYDGHEAEVLGFGAFFLEGCVGNDAVSGLFVPITFPGTEWTPLTGTNDFGARAVRLTN